MFEGTKSVESCPITRGNSTTMTEVSFKAICASKQAQTFQGNFVNKFCQICQGEKIPVELTFTDGIATGDLNVGKALSKAAAGKTETCELCNQHRSLFKAHGKRICTGCSQVVANVKNNPTLVIDIFNEYSDCVFPEDGTVITELKKQLEEANADCEKYLAELKASLEAPNATHAENRLQEEISSLKTEVSTKSARILDLDSHINQMRSLLDGKDQHLAAATGELERLKRESSIEKARAANNYDKGKIMVLLVDLAQAHIEGRVVVKADCFKELRKAATA